MFANVGSEEFESKYVRHQMPPIANIANILLGIRDKELALQDKTSQLDELKKKQRINRLEPCKNENTISSTQVWCLNRIISMYVWVSVRLPV